MAKICIDPGHYGKYNRSPGIPEYYESEMVWKLSQMQKKYLEAMGHTVVVTRSDPKRDLNLVTRGKRSKDCDLFISNHSNAVGNGMNETVSYVAVYHLVDDTTTKVDDISKDFAYKIAPVIANVMGRSYKVLTRKAESDRNADGIKNDNYYGVLHGARLVNTPGLILEHGFHTHTATVNWLLKDENLEKLAKAEAECIDKYFNGTSGSTEPEKPVVPEPAPTPAPAPSSDFKVRVTIKDLNIRKGPGTNYDRTGKFIDPGVYTIVKVQNGQGSKTGWGQLKSGAGWISLDFTTRL
jgi:N-acetylmuramoyl-L-alanine amidase